MNINRQKTPVGVEDTVERLATPSSPPGRDREIGVVSGEISSASLVAAFRLLARRGSGPLAWTAFFRHDPIAFLLDTASDAINLWGSNGELLYRNRAAEQLKIGRSKETAREVLWPAGRRFERRCCRFRCGNAEYVVEIIGRGVT